MAFSARDEELRRWRRRGSDRLPTRQRHVRAVVPFLPLDRADGAVRVGRAARLVHGGAGPLEARARLRGHLRQRRERAGCAGYGPPRRENGAGHGFQTLALVDRSSPLLRQE